MWILSKHGFISTVNYDPKKDRDPTSPFPSIAKRAGTHKLIRARRQEHLEPIRQIVPTLTIVDDRTADYRFRVVVKNAQYVEYLTWLSEDMDYWSHFKEAMKAAQPKHLAGPMYSAAMKVWGTFASLQASTPYGGSDRKDKPKHSSVSDYQRSRGVKPWTKTKSATADPFELPPVEDDEPQVVVDYAELFDEYEGFDPDPEGRITLGDLRELIPTRQNLIFSSAELGRMSDDAFELVCRLHEAYGTNAKVSRGIVDRHAAAIANEAEVASNG